MRADRVSRLFDEWASSFARGEQPDPQAFLERAETEAPALERLMEGFLLAAPRSEPDDKAVAAARAWIAGESPLVALRAARAVRRDDVVDAVMKQFELAAAKRAIVKRYVHRLEAGQLDPRRLSTPLVDLLQRLLGVSAATIRSARVRPLEARAAFRAADAALDALPSAVPGAEDDDEEVAALFLSGP
jgi:hypothetical protein